MTCSGKVATVTCSAAICLRLGDHLVDIGVERADGRVHIADADFD